MNIIVEIEDKDKNFKRVEHHQFFDVRYEKLLIKLISFLSRGKNNRYEHYTYKNGVRVGTSTYEYSRKETKKT